MERKNLDIVNKPTVEIFFLPERQKFLWEEDFGPELPSIEFCFAI